MNLVNLEELKQNVKVPAKLGKICPVCASNCIITKSFQPDGYNFNYTYQCVDCKSLWKGY